MLEPEPTVYAKSWSRAGAEIFKEPELEPAPETLTYRHSKSDTTRKKVVPYCLMESKN